MPSLLAGRWRRLAACASVAITLTVSCERAAAPVPTPDPLSMTLSCDGSSQQFACRARVVPVTSQGAAEAEVRDVTDSATWSTSDPRIVGVEEGNVVPRAIGTAAVTAAFRAGVQSLSSSVTVTVDADHAVPQLAYALGGEVRDPSNSVLPDVDVFLGRPDDSEFVQRWKLTTSEDGQFRFFPVVAGRYRLRAMRLHYRSVERDVEVPNTLPLTLVLLGDPINVRSR